ncbi:MAG: alpha/beta fold hydrolase [Schleiferiaceae bacterium]|nr:alpha/beta fold hydrolase [Schleiferiaceae bacterium]
MKLYSKILGDSGKDLVVMHGLFGMSDNWQTHGKAWAEEGFRVHLLDMRNHGQSPHSDAHHYQLMSDDVVEYFDAHAIENALVLGHSMGGKVAMLFATQNPERVEKLVVVDIAPKGYPVHHDEIINALKQLDFEVIKGRREADEVLAKYLDVASIRQFLLKSLYWKEKGRLAYRFNLEAIEKNIEMVGEPLAAIAYFDKPVQFIAGAQSNYIKATDSDKIHMHFPNAVIAVIEAAGHWVHAEQPETFYTTVTAFLKA